MVFTASRVKLLRQRMGWTTCDLARWLAVTSACVVSWEQGQAVPDEESCQQMQRIEGLLEQQMEKLRTQPLVDRILKENEWDQMTHDDIAQVSPPKSF